MLRLVAQNNFSTSKAENPSYGRQQISRRVRIVVQIPKHREIAKGCLSTFHSLSRCQVVFLPKCFWKKIDVEHNLRCWVLSQFEMLSLGTIWVVEFCHNLNFWVLSRLEFLSFVTIWVFELYQNVSIWVLSKFELLSFIKTWVFEFCHN